MDMFWKQWDLLKQPHTSSSGDLQEEGSVVTGDNSSMWINDPENSAVGQDMEVEDSGTNNSNPVQAQAKVYIVSCF